MGNEEIKSVAWYELPFYRSLTEQILFFGAPRSAIMVNALIAFLFIIFIFGIFCRCRSCFISAVYIWQGATTDFLTV